MCGIDEIVLLFLVAINLLGYKNIIFQSNEPITEKVLSMVWQ